MQLTSQRAPAPLHLNLAVLYRKRFKNPGCSCQESAMDIDGNVYIGVNLGTTNPYRCNKFNHQAIKTIDWEIEASMLPEK